MDITEVQIFVVNEDKLKAYASITLDNCFVIRDLKIIQGTTGTFVAMPAKKRKDGTFRDIAHPLNKDMRTKLETAVLKAFNEDLKRRGEPQVHSATNGESAATGTDPV
jgi:stage V sporulation protein G